MLSSNTEPAKSGDTKVDNILKSIPSDEMSPERLEEERRLSMERKSRRSEISRIYNERKLACIPSEKISKTYTEPTIHGKASLRLCSDISCGQLCCHYNEDFSLFAAGGVDGILRLYETTNFNLVRMISGGSDTKGCTACVTCIKHKPVVNPESIDHQFTISYVNGIVKCLNYNTKECKFTIKERRQTYGLSFHPRMPKFITYGDDLKINLYDHETQKKERTFKGSGEFHKNDGHTSRVFAAKFNPASNAEFLSGGWDNTVFLWDLRQPRAARFISDVHLCGEGLDIDKMGRQVLTCSWRKADQLQLWDYSTFKLISPIIPDPFESKLYCGRFLGSDFIACGGSDPSLFRVVDMLKKQSRVVISNLPSDVFHVNVGKYRYAWNNLTSSVKKNKSNSPEDLTKAPSVLFTAGGRIYTVDFNK